jgi:peptidyl-tRNA hydrolase
VGSSLAERRDVRSTSPDVGGSIPPPRSTASSSNGQDAESNDLRDEGSIPSDATTPRKLYGVVRGDLAPGLQAAQLAHAFVSYVLARPRETAQWHTESNNLVCLAVPDEAALSALAAAIAEAGHPIVCFHEPDLGDALTALAIGPEAQRLLSNVPLALRLQD